VILAADHEREQAVISLREHFARGRLTLEEFSERTELVLHARSRAELRRALAQLPQLSVRSIVQDLVRSAALVLMTGAWLLFSFTLVVVLGLTVLIHGATMVGFAGFLLVWLVPTYLLSRVWRRRPFRRHG
jgi:Flp pilus assembly protein TadB